ncbi:hypothetical protein GNIT_0669 [Glaciecola nitratireducens FR1064]|uniref:Uncharacterized protein n=1 Tax=Glaciecola nitratireducens (strain JCM 12485 / KCTC 12276 / FR1064) TaxID=1085623 RepID=G4QFN2_GLANF|nr:hypothetical protein GNIT_0669 [Glaciecola nitratireducens FR1064]
MLPILVQGTEYIKLVGSNDTNFYYLNAFFYIDAVMYFQ